MEIQPALEKEWGKNNTCVLLTPSHIYSSVIINKYIK